MGSVNLKKERIGLINTNKEGYQMRIIDYINNQNVIVEFNDEEKTQVQTAFYRFEKGTVRRIRNLKEKRNGLISTNNQGSIMKIIKYNTANDIEVEFQDKYKAVVHTSYDCFITGGVKNPYYHDVYGIGCTGTKYPTSIKQGDKWVTTKEYSTWLHMLERCYLQKCKDVNPTYQNATTCEEWLNFENFYEWLHSQENYTNWANLKWSALDKDIIGGKGNKLYCPDTTCLVPVDINELFVKRNKLRGDLPIGVRDNIRGFLPYRAYCGLGTKKKGIELGSYSTPEEAFLVYKTFKENLIKKKAEKAYSQGKITKRCYDAMMEYQVEITD